jgi:hypothetical protein
MREGIICTYTGRMLRDVLICCAPADESAGLKVCEFLEAEKISCWMAARDLAAGEDEQAMTAEAVDGCPVMVLIFSQNANASGKVQDQVERALGAEKILIPLRIENVAPEGRMEESLRHRYRHDALVGPLERHLPEVVRMLKPLLHRLVVKTREATSISRTLPSRSSIVRGAEGQKGGAASGELELALHFPHPVFAGHPTVVEVRLQNASPAERVELTLEGLGVKRRVTHVWEEIASEAARRCRLTLEPSRSGRFPLHATVVQENKSTRRQLVGTRSFRVNAAPATNGVMRPDAVMVNDDKADLFLAAPSKEAEAGLPVSELLAITVPEDFQPMALTPEFDVARSALDALKPAGALEFAPGLSEKGQPATLLRLEPEQATEEPFQDIRLVARPSFHVGRSREESDYLGWFWPRNDVHDTKTRRISKKHCTFLREGATLTIRSTASGSITTFDGQDLAGAETLVLDGIGTLNLSGIYELGVARFPSTLTAAPVAPHEESPRGSVSFISRTPNILPQHTLWMLTDGSFGSSRANPLPLDAAGLAEIQGRFHHDQGFFWIESVVDNGAVEVDGVALTRGQIAPLGHGMRVRLGDRWFRAAVEA